MDLEEYLLKNLIKEKITLIGDDGVAYTFDGHKTRHPDCDFCFESGNHGISQFSYRRIKKWQVITEAHSPRKPG